MMVDISDIPGVQLEEPVTVIGNNKNETVSADSLAGLANTVNYEIISRINARRIARTIMAGSTHHLVSIGA